MNRIELAGRILSLGSENKGCDKTTKADVLQEAMKLIRDYEAQEQANGDKTAHEKCTLPVDMPSALKQMTDKELKVEEYKRLNKIGEIHKELKDITNEQFYRYAPECRPH